MVLIFGISGGCRRQELKNLMINHVRDLGNEFQIKLVDTKTKTDRSFVIPGTFYDLSKKYILLRPPDTEYFFVNYQKGKCTRQKVGINKLGNQPKVIAEFLKLPNADLYTGHCFRRSGATILADAGCDTLTVKNFGGWKSTAVMETYIEHSLSKKKEIATTILRSVDTLDNTEPEIKPSTSKVNIQPNILASTSSTYKRNTYVDLEKKASTTYENCTFNNCTFIIKKSNSE